MKIYALKTPIIGELSNIAFDKSISHRSAIFSLLSNDVSVIKNYLFADDTNATLEIIKLLGAKVEILKNLVKITPPKDIKEPSQILDCKNSGTAMRILMGLLASKNGFFILNGDRYGFSYCIILNGLYF